LKLITWNVNGVRAREAELLRLFDEENPDVVMLQETKATIDQLPPSLHGLMALPEYHSIWHGSAGYSGVSLHLRKSVFARPTDAHPSFDFETRVVEAHTGDFVFVSMYLPNGGKDFQAKLGFLGALATYPHTFAGKTLVVAGDLNVARTDLDVHESERKARAIGQRPKERELFERFLAASSRRTTPGSSRGGRTGTSSARGTSVGASTTCSRTSRSRRARPRRACGAISGRAITRR